jgi:hypothetical protein
MPTFRGACTSRQAGNNPAAAVLQLFFHSYRDACRGGGIAYKPCAEYNQLSTSFGFGPHVHGVQEDAGEFLDKLFCVLHPHVADVCKVVLCCSRICTTGTHKSDVSDTQSVIQVGVPCLSVTAAITEALTSCEMLPDFRCNQCFAAGACRSCCDLVRLARSRCRKHSSTTAPATTCDDCIGKVLTGVNKHGSMPCSLSGGAWDQKVIVQAGSALIVQLKRFLL